MRRRRIIMAVIRVMARSTSCAMWLSLMLMMMVRVAMKAMSAVNK